MAYRVVVTGGAGFLGSHLCTRLVQKGHEVTSVDNSITGSAGNLAHLLSEPNFKSLASDISYELTIPGPVDLVLHFACPASPIDYLKAPIETLRVGSAGTENALKLAREKGARFLLASTSEVYGDPLVHPQTEDYWGNVNPIGPRSVYDEAKRFSEALTMAYRRSFDVNTAIIRIFNTYGPRMRAHDGRAIPTFIRQALANEPLTVAGDGQQTRSLCYVEDLISGVLAMAMSSQVGPVNLGNPGELTVLAMAQEVIAATGSSSEIAFVPRPVDDPQVRCPDITQARELLGWEPKIDWPTGLRQTLDWWTGQSATAGTPQTLAQR